ncbi:unnamed protein product [Linum trigynum]|uniref:Uncharacterized protein n=1 Tax=Linum trigynum TaxID=586398 RepID=A0AAV2GPX2_9ROSI
MASNSTGNIVDVSVIGGDGDRRCLTELQDGGSTESLRYYHSRRTVMEMLKDRGYDVPGAELSRSLAEFRTEFGEKPEPERLRITASLRSNTHKKVLVLFMGATELKVAAVRNVYKQILGEGLGLSGLILILEAKITIQAKKHLETFPFKVEVYQITDLIANVSKHVLQPSLEILTAHRKQMLMKKYKAEDKLLPRMLETDAIAKYYGLQKGQVVELTYSGGLIDFLTAYRCVI